MLGKVCESKDCLHMHTALRCEMSMCSDIIGTML